jgi:tetratricopeptide (TPR) repeat protein
MAPASPSPRRLLAFRVVSLTVVPLAFFLVLEGLLHLLGFGFPASFVLEDEIGGREVYRDNTQFSQRFFPPPLYRSPRPFVLPQEKLPGTYRIVVLGESAAMGDPEPAFGLSRVLEALLRDQYPDRKFEVVNAAVTAINSHAIVDIARDTRTLEPDAYLVYMGNNEVVGPYGVGTVFSAFTRNRTVIRTQLWVKRSRIGQGADRLGRWLGAGQGVPTHWTGMEMFLGHEVRATDPGLAAVHEHFRKNLEAILGAARASGAQVLLSTVATDLRDTPPFASKHRPDLSPDDEKKWKALVDEGDRAEHERRPEDALAAYAKAAAIDDQHAELAYRQARTCYRMKRFEEAGGHYVRARDLDALRFRADSVINKTIRDAAAGWKDKGVVLVDSEQALARQCPEGILGGEVFFEHVHMSLPGNYGIAKAAMAALAPALGAGRSGEPLSLNELTKRLGYSPWHHQKLLLDMLDRFRRPPFSNQLDTKVRDAWLRRRIHEMRTKLPAARLSKMADEVQAGTANDPSWESHMMLAQLLDAAGRPREAITEWQRVVEAIPHSIETRSFLAGALFRVGRAQDSLAQSEEMRRLRPDSPEAWNNIGAVHASRKEWGLAEAAYTEALVRDPSSFEATINRGMTMGAQGRMDEARDVYMAVAARTIYSPEQKYQLGLFAQSLSLFSEAIAQGRAALALDPRHEGAFELVTVGYRKTMQLEEALRFFAEQVEADPENPLAHRALARFLQGTDQLEGAVYHYRAALELDPQLASVHASLAHTLVRLGKPKEAVATMEAAMKAFPDSQEPYQRLAGLYMEMSDPVRAIATYRLIRERWPNDWVATTNLAWNLAAAPERRIRNGKEALSLAQEAMMRTQGQDPQVLNVLAAAYAENGQYDEAVETAKKAVELANAAGKPELAQKIASAGAVYAKRQPFPEGKGIALPQIAATGPLAPPAAPRPCLDPTRALPSPRIARRDAPTAPTSRWAGRPRSSPLVPWASPASSWSTSTRRGACTGTFAWSWAGCWCRGPSRRGSHSIPRTSIWPCTSRTIRWSTATTRA